MKSYKNCVHFYFHAHNWTITSNPCAIVHINLDINSTVSTEYENAHCWPSMTPPPIQSNSLQSGNIRHLSGNDT